MDKIWVDFLILMRYNLIGEERAVFYEKNNPTASV